MRQKLLTTLGTLLMCVLVAFGVKYDRDVKASEALLAVQGQVASLNMELVKQRAQEEEDLKLGQYTINMMMATYGGRKLSDARKQVLARSITKVATDVFESVEQRHAFVMILAIESQFQKYAQSPTGPKGLTQVAHKTFFEALERCGMKNDAKNNHLAVAEEDVWDTDLNLYAGACYFRAQLEDSGGDLFIAAVKYNQGPSSKEAEKFAKTGNLDNLEALKYLAKVTFLKRTVNEKRTPEAPKFKMQGS